MVRRSYFVCPMSPFLYGCRYFADAPSRYDVAKGSTSFGAAHLRFRSVWFVTFIPAVSVVFSYDEESFCVYHVKVFATDNECAVYLVQTKLVCIHLIFFATDHGLK